MKNPYQSPTPSQAIAAPHAAAKPPTSLAALAGGLLLTEAFALINALDEELPSWTFTLLVIAIAGVSQLPGLLIAYWRWKTRSVAAVPLLVGAYGIAVTGGMAYAAYALNGKADSLNSAAQMHVIAFPVLHCILAVLIYAACGAVSAVCCVFAKFKRRGEPSPMPEPADESASGSESSLAALSRSLPHRR